MDAALNPPPPASLTGRGRVATLGQFIIDHFEAAGKDGNVVRDEPTMGGGGLYAMAAARMFLPAAHVGYIVDVGDDFPPEFRRTLEGLGDMVWFRPRKGNTTRALNQYSGAVIGEGRQTFKYLSPTLQLHPTDLLGPSSPFAHPPPEWVHVVCDVTRATAIALEADSFRRKGWLGHMVWEPLIRKDDEYTAQQYAALAKRYTVFSPNHIELQAILDSEADVEECARLFHGYLVMSPGPVPAVVVRAGERGAFTLSPEWTGWVPAFWREGEEKHIVDVTGGGNAFLGGLIAGLFLTRGDFLAASIYASTAASFAIEQRGIPTLTATKEGHELWNGVFPWHRLRQLARRMGVLDTDTDRRETDDILSDDAELSP